MAQISLGEARWRMLRRVVRKRRFTYDDARGMSKADPVHFAWLIAKGFIAKADGLWHELTDKGKDASDLGLYEV